MDFRGISVRPYVEWLPEFVEYDNSHDWLVLEPNVDGLFRRIESKRLPFVGTPWSRPFLRDLRTGDSLNPCAFVRARRSQCAGANRILHEGDSCSSGDEAHGFPGHWRGAIGDLQIRDFDQPTRATFFSLNGGPAPPYLFSLGRLPASPDDQCPVRRGARLNHLPFQFLALRTTFNF